MGRNIQWIMVVVIIVLVGGMVYKQNFAAPVPQEEITAGVLSSSEQEIETALENGDSIWILFRSTTCVPCVEMQKIFDQLKPEYEGKVKFIEVDVNDRANINLLQEYKLQYIPTTFIMDGQGNISYHNVGVVPLDELTAELDRVVTE
ncbi:putative thioredoxin domain protein [hydrocarbon metagenome]|uniref:Putative thioredoxin domain protein n=1 Tax=hydrocarbon metagenome TaxID=938273 RepID=A0A0W8E4N7_9ZZZZ